MYILIGECGVSRRDPNHGNLIKATRVTDRGRRQITGLLMRNHNCINLEREKRRERENGEIRQIACAQISLIVQNIQSMLCQTMLLLSVVKRSLCAHTQSSEILCKRRNIVNHNFQSCEHCCESSGVGKAQLFCCHTFLFPDIYASCA